MWPKSSRVWRHVVTWDARRVCAYRDNAVQITDESTHRREHPTPVESKNGRCTVSVGRTKARPPLPVSTAGRHRQAQPMTRPPAPHHPKVRHQSRYTSTQSITCGQIQPTVRTTGHPLHGSFHTCIDSRRRPSLLMQEIQIPQSMLLLLSSTAHPP